MTADYVIPETPLWFKFLWALALLSAVMIGGVLVSLFATVFYMLRPEKDRLHCKTSAKPATAGAHSFGVGNSLNEARALPKGEGAIGDPAPRAEVLQWRAR